MANSKSNIYPVQLQNAELNLNKYDAEIKQYSGFNKNNSPFVGGCLSNVFQKNDTIEDANDSNTYIAKNGDIYSVNTEGLFRNNEKLIDYTGLDFIEREKVELPYNDVIKAYSDKVFLRQINNDLYLNDIYLGKNGHFGFSDEDFLTKYTCGIWYHGKFIWAGWVYTTDWYLKIITLEKDSEGVYVLGNVNYTTPSQSYPPTANIRETNEFSPLSIIISNGYFNVIYTRLVTSGSISFHTYFHYGNFDNSTVTRVDKTINIISFDSDWIYYQSNYIKNIYNNNYISVEIDINSYPRNELVFKNFYNYPITNFNQKALAISVKLDAEESQEALVLHSANVTKYINTLDGMELLQLARKSSPRGLNIESSIINYNVSVAQTAYNNVRNFRFGSPTGAILDWDDSFPYNFKVVGGAIGTIENCDFALLINNNTVSGIAAFKDNNNILVTNWNTVDDTLITYVQEDETDKLTLFYGDTNGNYYYLRTSQTPKLKRVYNQLITNVLYNHNSWFLDKDKPGYFATGFNSSFYYVSADAGLSILSLARDTPQKYIAMAINEYNLEDNASIIINQFRCRINAPYLKGVNFAGIDVFETEEGGVAPVYYRTYFWSGSETYWTVKNYGKLAYPTDTNGNISYNPSIFSDIINIFGNKLLIKENDVLYFLQTYDNRPVMSYYMLSGVENIETGFIIQGQHYCILDNGIYNMQNNNGVTSVDQFIVDVSNLQFVGNTPYEALFFSKTNRCLYSFIGANVLNQKQLVDKISEVRNYLYNPATQTVFLITDIGVLFYGLFGMFLLEYTDITNIFLLDNGIVMSDNSGNYRYIKYYLDESDEGYTKENIRLETCFYGMNNEVVTINDCLYFRLFSEEHEEGDLKVKATTISLKGRQTEETTFKIKASDWDKITHTLYLRYQPKTQRGLGVSFSIDSPFKIASMSVGSQPDAVLVDKVSKGAINAPFTNKSSTIEW